MKHPLKIARILVQLTSLITITWMLMTAPTAAVIAIRGSVEHWMLIPTAMIGSASVVGFWLIITLAFGRIYCSTVCPLGTIQDIAANIGCRFKHAKPYRYKPPLHGLSKPDCSAYCSWLWDSGHWPLHGR